MMKIDGMSPARKLERVSTRVWWIVSCALAGIGCIRGEAAMTEERFCQEYARIECSKVAAFCSFNPATCQPVREAACRLTAGQLKSGGHQFNPDNTDPCLKKLQAAYQTLHISAAMLKGVDDTCDRLFAGTAKAAEVC